MLRHDGYSAEAVPYLEKAGLLRPASPEARFQIGMVNVAMGRLEKARTDLERVEQDSPDFQEVHVQLAGLYARLHRIDDSERERAIILKLNEKAREKGPQPQR
jgi:tetratricopeptide (TPR) repeat protein